MEVGNPGRRVTLASESEKRISDLNELTILGRHAKLCRRAMVTFVRTPTRDVYVT